MLLLELLFLLRGILIINIFLILRANSFLDFQKIILAILSQRIIQVESLLKRKILNKFMLSMDLRAPLMAMRCIIRLWFSPAFLVEACPRVYFRKLGKKEVLLTVSIVSNLLIKIADCLEFTAEPERIN